MDIIQLTRELGSAIQQDERYLTYAAAKKANDEDEQLQTDIGEFNLVRLSLDKELASNEKDNDKINEYNDRLRNIYSKVMANSAMLAYNEAKTSLDELVGQINTIITKTIGGEDPLTCELSSGCGGSCSSCSGCH